MKIETVEQGLEALRSFDATTRATVLANCLSNINEQAETSGAITAEEITASLAASLQPFIDRR